MTFFYTKKKSLINKNLIHLSNNIFKNAYECNDYQIINKNVCEINARLISKEPIFEKIMKDICRDFKKIINFSDLKFKKLWLVDSASSETKKNVLPYLTHFDKSRYLKAMVYLHDINYENGPIHLGKTKKNVDVERMRKNLPEDYKKKGLNILNKNQIEGNLTPMLGEAGDVIFFDTNTPHRAGEIKEGYSRKVLRFDFERPINNPKISIFDRIINKIHI